MPSYDRVARLLHWAIAAGVLALAGLGPYMTRARLALPDKLVLYQLHKSLGLAVLALMLVRIVWRLTHRAPPLPGHMRRWEKAAARATHTLLYLLLVLVPVSGWLMVSGSPVPVPTRVFWLVTVPHVEPLASWPPEARRAWAPLLKQVHLVMAITLLALVAGHVAAALRHHFILGDDVLRRMLPGAGRRRALVLVALLGGAGALGAPAASAQESPAWKVDAARSTLTFEATAAGQRFPGSFKSFAADIRFDPAAPERVRIAATIDIAGISTGTAEIDDALAGRDWFDARQFPQARFAAEASERAGDGAYRLAGTLTLKGRSQPVAVAFRLSLAGDRARADGEATIDRLAFGIGPEGAIEGTAVAREVRVRLVIEADRVR